MTADAVALESRKAADDNADDNLADTSPSMTEAGARQPAPSPASTPVVSLTERRLAQLPADTRPLPSVAIYDQLLCHRGSPTTTPPSTSDSASGGGTISS